MTFKVAGASDDRNGSAEVNSAKAQNFGRQEEFWEHVRRGFLGYHHISL